MRWMLNAALISSPTVGRCGAVFGLKEEDSVTEYLKSRLDNDFKGLWREFVSFLGADKRENFVVIL